jgi:TolA-binding protein
MSDNHNNTGVVILICVALTIFLWYLFLENPEFIKNLAAKASDVQSVGDGAAYNQGVKISELTQEIADMQAQMDDLRHQLMEAQGAINQKDEEIKSDMTRIDGLNAAIANLERQNKALSEKLASLPDYQKKYEKEKDGFHFSIGVSGASAIHAVKPEGMATIGMGKGNWQIITGVGYSADGPKVSLGVQWTF